MHAARDLLINDPMVQRSLHPFFICKLVLRLSHCLSYHSLLFSNTLVFDNRGRSFHCQASKRAAVFFMFVRAIAARVGHT